VDGLHLSLATFTTPACGNGGYSDLPNIKITGTVAHGASSLTFQVNSYLDEDGSNESFGFRDLTLIFDDNPIVTETLCAYLAGYSSMGSKQCTCPTGQYYTGSACASCNGACASCYGGSASQCYACASGYGWDGNNCVACPSYCQTCFGSASNECSVCTAAGIYFSANSQCLYDCPYPLNKVAGTYGTNCVTPCSTSTDFIYWDKSCASSCPAPYQQKSVASVGVYNLCIYPCSPTDFLYWDGTCDTTCPAPLVRSVYKNAQLCTFSSCSATQYLNVDGTCSSSCAYPLISQTIKGRKLCLNPCSSLTGQYLYWNQECSSSCAPPLTSGTVGGVLYCNYGCTGSNYLYWDSRCLPTCPFPLSMRTQRGKLFCDYPTSTTNFLYWDGTGSASCDPPLVQRVEGTPSRNFCDYKCQIWEYLYWDGTCASTCIFPLTKRIQNGRQFCDNICTGTNYLYWNGSCLGSCDGPLTTSSANSRLYCDFPAGNTSNFVYWDGTFLETCPPPFIQSIEGSPLVRKFCYYPCTGSQYLDWRGSCVGSCSSPGTPSTYKGKQLCNVTCSEYLNYDGTCVSSCDYPMTITTDYLAKSCNHPCTTTTDFYYWNSTCHSTCSSPLKQQKIGQVSWCVYPCAGEEYLYTNGSCSPSCDAPFTPKVEANFHFCFNPCPLFTLMNGTCVSTCKKPLRIEKTNMGDFCLSPCEDPLDYYFNLTKKCSSKCLTNSVEKEGGLYVECITYEIDTSSALDLVLEAPSGNDFTLVTVARVPQYVRYADIDYPERLMKLAESRGKSLISLRYEQPMSASMQSLFVKYDLPEVFTRDNMHSNFVVNFWSELISWIIVMIAAGIIISLQWICSMKKWTSLESFFEKLRITVQWNFLLILFGSSVNSIALYVSQQFRTQRNDASMSVLSLEFSIAILAVLVVFVIGIVYLVREHHAVKLGQNSYQKVLQEWRGYQICFRGFNHQARYFYLIYLVRVALPGVIAAWLYVSPLLQTILYVSITSMMLAYILMKRPILNTLNYVQLILTETGILVMDICLLSLVISDRAKISASSGSSELLGDMIIGTNSLINILFITVLVIKLADGFVTIYKRQKAEKTTSLAGYVQLVVYIFQQTGFGFEEISVNTQAEIKKEEELMADEREREELLQTRRSQMMKNKPGRIFPETRREEKSSSRAEQISRTLTSFKGVSMGASAISVAASPSIVLQEVSFVNGSPNLSIEKLPGEEEGNAPLVMGDIGSNSNPEKIKNYLKRRGGSVSEAKKEENV